MQDIQKASSEHKLEFAALCKAMNLVFVQTYATSMYIEHSHKRSSSVSSLHGLPKIHARDELDGIQ